MFERFTKEARFAVIGAQEVARDLGDGDIGTEHILLALMEGDGPAVRALRDHGQTADGLRAVIARLRRRSDDPLDPEALRALGIDLEAVREATEEVFGEGALDAPAGRFRRGRKGHIPFTPKAKKSLELSLRHAIRLKHDRIGDGHILLGLLHDQEFQAVRVLTGADVDIDALRADVTRLISANAA